jgi:hypothetical protein
MGHERISWGFTDKVRRILDVVSEMVKCRFSNGATVGTAEIKGNR